MTHRGFGVVAALCLASCGDDPLGDITVLDVTHGDAGFVAVGYDTRDGSLALLHSTDGRAWTAVDLELEEVEGSGIVFGNGVYVVAAHDPYGLETSGLLLTSADGRTWEVHETAAETIDIAFGDDLFVATAPWDGGDFFTSTDGKAWTEQALRSAPIYLTFGAGVFVGSSFDQTVSVSHDGTNWSEVDALESDFWFGGHLSFAGGRFWALVRPACDMGTECDPPLLASSTDGEVWNFVEGVSDGLGEVVEFRGALLASGETAVWSSDDGGDTWSKLAEAGGASLRLATDGSMVVAVSEQGRMRVSNDGVVWSDVSLE